MLDRLESANFLETRRPIGHGIDQKWPSKITPIVSQRYSREWTNDRKTRVRCVCFMILHTRVMRSNRPFTRGGFILIAWGRFAINKIKLKFAKHPGTDLISTSQNSFRKVGLGRTII